MFLHAFCACGSKHCLVLGVLFALWDGTLIVRKPSFGPRLDTFGEIRELLHYCRVRVQSKGVALQLCPSRLVMVVVMARKPSFGGAAPL